MLDNKDEKSDILCPHVCLREKDLNKIFNCSDTTRKRLVKDPDFPKPFRLNETFKVWDSADIYNWLELRKNICRTEG